MKRVLKGQYDDMYYKFKDSLCQGSIDRSKQKTRVSHVWYVNSVGPTKGTRIYKKMTKKKYEKEGNC